MKIPGVSRSQHLVSARYTPPKEIDTSPSNAFVGKDSLEDTHAATETLVNVDLTKHETDKESGVSPADCPTLIVTPHLRNHGHTNYISLSDGDLADASALILHLS